MAGSFTGQLDHISANTAQQHRHHGETDTRLWNRNSKRSVTSTPQAAGSTVCVLNVHSLSCHGGSSISNRQQEKRKQVGSYHTTETYNAQCASIFLKYSWLLMEWKTHATEGYLYLQYVVQVRTHTYFQLARIFRLSVWVYNTVCVNLSWGFPELGEVWTRLSSGHRIHRLSHLCLCWPEHAQPLWLCSSMICQRTRVYSKKWHAAFQNNVIRILRKKKKKTPLKLRTQYSDRTDDSVRCFF